MDNMEDVYQVGSYVKQKIFNVFGFSEETENFNLFQSAESFFKNTDSSNEVPDILLEIIIDLNLRVDEVEKKLNTIRISLIITMVVCCSIFIVWLVNCFRKDSTKNCIDDELKNSVETREICKTSLGAEEMRRTSIDKGTNTDSTRFIFNLSPKATNWKNGSLNLLHSQ